MKRKASLKGKNKAIFDELLRHIRIDFGHLRKLHEVLVNKISTEPQEENTVVRQEIMEWILDVLVDKAYELESKVGIIFKKIMSKEVPVNVDTAVAELRRVALRLVSGRNDPLEPYDYLDNLRVFPVLLHQQCYLSYLEKQHHNKRGGDYIYELVLVL
jgi:hypothetical protein